MTLSALVVGLGRMGSFHAKVLRDLGYNVRTVDPDPEKGADYLSIAEARLAASPLSGFKYDVSAIATPAEYLLDSAYQLAGLPMLVEKPFALTSRDARMLGAYLKQAGAPVCVGYVERFNPVVRTLHEWPVMRTRIDRAEFVRHGTRPSWDMDLDLLTHDIDLALHLGIRLDCCDFDVRGDQALKRRSITITPEDGIPTTADLMAHDQSPLHAMWHAFLTGKPVPAPSEAAQVLEVIEHMSRAEEAIAA